MKWQLNQTCNLKDFLQVVAHTSSNTQRKEWVKQRRITVNGSVVTKMTKQVKPGEVVRLLKKEQPLEQEVKLLYEDRDLVIVNKPANLLSVETDTESFHTLHAILKRRRLKGRVFPVHRLDQQASGVICFAYSQKAREGLQEQFATHSAKREYCVAVEGIVEKNQGTITSNLYEQPDYKVRSHPYKGALAITHFSVVKRYPSWTLMRVSLQTGKKHQIRVHLSENGHPVLGDERYGSTKNPFHRLALHAYRLELIHPTTGKKLAWHALPPFPKGFDFAKRWN